MPGPSFGFFLSLASLVGTALVLVKLLHTGLFRRYRIFSCYFIFRIVLFLGTLVLDVRSKAYLYFFIVTEPITLLFYLLVVRELVGLILEKYSGLRSLGRWFMYGGIGIAAAVALASVVPKIRPEFPLASKATFWVFGLDRGVSLSLVVFLLLILAFLSRYPVALGRNVLVHAGLFTLFFSCNTLAILLKTVKGQTWLATVDTVLVGFGAVCMFAWLFLLSPQGEDVKVTIPNFTPEQEARILYRLDSLNATLLKVGGK